MVRRLLCILLVELPAFNGRPETGATARILNQLDGASYHRKQVESTVKEMLDAGSKYRNLERVLGDGVLFVLGQDIAESYWTKLLPKSGSAFDQAVNRLKSVNIPEIASRYSNLRKAVIDSKLTSMISGVPKTFPDPQPSYTGPDFSTPDWSTSPSQALYPPGASSFEDPMDYWA